MFTPTEVDIRCRRTGTGRDLRGWDARSLADFDAMWHDGVKVEVIARRFNISLVWVNYVRRRRELPTRQRVA